MCKVVIIHGKGHAFGLYKTDSGAMVYLEGEEAEPEVHGP